MTALTTLATSLRQDAAEDLGYGVRRRWLLDGRAVAYLMAGPATDPATTDVWKMAVLEDLHRWPSQQPYLALHDLRPGGTVSQARQAAETLLACWPEGLTGRYAAVVRRDIAGTLARWLGGYPRRRADDPLAWGCFHRVDDALTWLRHGLVG